MASEEEKQTREFGSRQCSITLATDEDFFEDL